MPGQILYKFRNWSDPIHKRWLTEQQVYFASPSQFNDPFDCAINYRYDLLTYEDKLEKYTEHIKVERPFLSDEEVKIEAEKWIKEGLLETDAMLENNKRIIRDLVYTKVGVLSLTKTKNPILLWSHYSDNHKGFCIGYDVNILRDDFLKKYNDPKKVFFEIDVNYSNDYPIMVPKKDISADEYIRVPISTKSKVWVYEEEYRFFILGAAGEQAIVPAEAISEIIMGCKISDRDQYEIGDYVIKNMPHTALYLAKMHHESFELVFNKMN